MRKLKLKVRDNKLYPLLPIEQDAHEVVCGIGFHSQRQPRHKRRTQQRKTIKATPSLPAI